MNVSLLCNFRMDEILKALPPGIERSDKEDKEKVREIFNWITTHIEYDMDAYNKKIYDTTSLTETSIRTLRRRKTVCTGYSSLFHLMCQ